LTKRKNGRKEAKAEKISKIDGVFKAAMRRSISSFNF
jgi:hypothetical protein